MVVHRGLLLGPVVKKRIRKWCFQDFSSQNGQTYPRGPPSTMVLGWLGRGGAGARDVQSEGSGRVGGQEGKMLEH